MIASMPRVLFLVASVTTLALALPTAMAASRSRQIHLRFYMHDITSGPGQTAVQLVKGTGPAHPFMSGAHFGDTTVIDDALTEG
uniref:Dirigent protein n=1 Tax=Triticum urartu TaxID=4572 RepID=A0A8R7VF47_TRIUA